MELDLKRIANNGGFGTGEAVRDLLHARATRRSHIPAPDQMRELVVEHSVDALVASFGNDADDGLDYHINAIGYSAIADGSTAGQDARAMAALWNAYRDGDLVWK